MTPAPIHASALERIDWGFGDFGAISLLLALLVVAAWGFASLRRGGFWLSPGLSFLPGTGLALFYPTWGGIIGALAGLGFLAFWFYPEATRNRIIGVAMALLLLAALTLFAPKNAASLKKHGEETTPLASLVSIWKAVPHLLLDAPDGWGKSSPSGWDATGTGPAYMLGYQPFTEPVQEYRTLVGSHFTWLAEHGWACRILYVCAWSWAGILVWPSRKHRWLAVCAGIWVTLGVAGFFSPTLTFPAVWILPLVALLIAAGFRLAASTWPIAWTWLLVPFAASLTFLLFILGGAALFPSQVPIHREENRTIIGYGTPTVWFIHPYVDVVGHHFGQGLRSLVLSARDKGRLTAIGVAPSLDDAGQRDPARTIYVFSYKNIATPLPANARCLIFLNTWLTRSVEWPAARTGKHDLALIGAGMFDNNNDGLSRDKARWKLIQAADPTFTLITLDSTGYYLPMPRWTDPLLKIILEEN